jgi:chromosomal replication initiation ATPase DnaA
MSTQVLPVISKPMVERIIEGTCLYFGITEDILKLKNAGMDIVYYRKICWCIIREQTSMSYGRIAARFGFTDHKHVMLFVDEMQARRNIYPQIFHDLQKVKIISDNIDAVVNRNV